MTEQILTQLDSMETRRLKLDVMSHSLPPRNSERCTQVFFSFHNNPVRWESRRNVMTGSRTFPPQRL